MISKKGFPSSSPNSNNPICVMKSEKHLSLMNPYLFSSWHDIPDQVQSISMVTSDLHVGTEYQVTISPPPFHLEFHLPVSHTTKTTNNPNAPKSNNNKQKQNKNWSNPSGSHWHHWAFAEWSDRRPSTCSGPAEPSRWCPGCAGCWPSPGPSSPTHSARPPPACSHPPCPPAAEPSAGPVVTTCTHTHTHTQI